MKPKTKEEIAAEIAALKKLVPVGPFARKTAACISLIIEELDYGVDQTSEEWTELSDEERDAVEQTYAWKIGGIKDRPSKGWEGLCA